MDAEFRKFLRRLLGVIMLIIPAGICVVDLLRNIGLDVDKWLALIGAIIILVAWFGVGFLFLCYDD